MDPAAPVIEERNQNWKIMSYVQSQIFFSFFSNRDRVPSRHEMVQSQHKRVRFLSGRVPPRQLGRPRERPDQRSQSFLRR